MDLNQEDNLILQCYLITSFLTELKNADFLNSEYYNNLSFEDNFVKENITKIGIDNQGSLLIFLYALLVIPKQLLESKFPNEFNALNVSLDSINESARSSYSTDSNGIDYVRHVRNSVAHARVKFDPNISVTFTDNNNRGENCTIVILLSKIGPFLTELQKIFITYVEELRNT
jgi:hypothetical protein